MLQACMLCGLQVWGSFIAYRDQSWAASEIWDPCESGTKPSEFVHCLKHWNNRSITAAAGVCEEVQRQCPWLNGWLETWLHNELQAKYLCRIFFGHFISELVVLNPWCHWCSLSTRHSISCMTESVCRLRTLVPTGWSPPDMQIDSHKTKRLNVADLNELHPLSIARRCLRMFQLCFGLFFGQWFRGVQSQNAVYVCVCLPDRIDKVLVLRDDYDNN